MIKVRRDNNGIAHIVPVSGGKDSTCLALALKKNHPLPYNYIHTPTGDELPEMVDHLKRLEDLLDSEIIKITNGTLDSQIKSNNMLPNVFARWCTRILKLRPAGKFYEQNAPVICYVGLRADEDDREGLRPGGDSASINTEVVQKFPFKEWGWGLNEVMSFLSENGVSVPQRTDCARCPYQRLGEWYNLWLNHPDIYSSAEQDELNYGHTYRSPNRDTWPHELKELRKKFESGIIPTRSLNMMEKRKNMCRACSL